MRFTVKPSIISGEDSLSIIKEIRPKKIFLITDPFMVESKIIDPILDFISSDFEYDLFTEVKPDPSQDLVDKALEDLDKYGSDMVLALGGGSAIDLAKAMIYKSVKEKMALKPKFIAIPTTAGTGSEVTNFAVVTRGKDKVVLVDDVLLPDYALLIPSLTKTVPNFITADTGMDVLTHAIEAYVSKDANKFTDLFAIEAIKLVFENLKTVFDDGLRMKARKNMLEASCMAGIAFTNAGLGINHSLAHTIGGRFHIAHGRLNAILLPSVLEFNTNRSDDARKKVDELGKILGFNSGKCFIKAIKNLSGSLKIPATLSELGKIDFNNYQENIDQMAETALKDRCTPTNPAYVTKFDLANILRDLY